MVCDLASDKPSSDCFLLAFGYFWDYNMLYHFNDDYILDSLN